jgi:NAD(P)-dependent dehydrogenase (short-subunit alcohol dehydrogenase family)
MGVEDKPVVVITGASQGLGAAIALAFAAEGAVRLVLLARNEERLREVARRCEVEGGEGVEAWPLICDVAEVSSIAAAERQVHERWGAPNVLINNAGVFAGASFLEMPTEMFDRQLVINLRSVFLVSQAFGRAMAMAGRGDIINIASVAAVQAHPNGSGYCAAKAGLLGLSRVMREELKAHGIRVTVVHPGAIATPSWDGSGVPEARMMAPDDVAGAVVAATRLSGRSVMEEIILRPMQGDL